MEVAGGDSDSEFEFSRQLVPSLPSADELFHDGVIRPLKPLTKQDGFEVASLGRARDPAPRNPPLFPLRASEFGPHHPSSSSMGGLKWRLKDLLLYRSASEGRPLKSYSYSYSVSPLLMGWKSSAGEASSRRHYHRPNSEEEEEEEEQLKNKKTSLSYKHGFLSCMGFNNSSSSSSSRHHRKLSSCF